MQAIRHFFQIFALLAFLLCLTRVATAGDVPMAIINFAGEPVQVSVCWFEKSNGSTFWKCESYDIGIQGYVQTTIPVGAHPLHLTSSADFRAYCRKADGTSISTGYYDRNWGDDVKVISEYGGWPVCRKLD